VPRWVKSKGVIIYNPRHIIVELVRGQMGGHEELVGFFWCMRKKARYHA